MIRVFTLILVVIGTFPVRAFDHVVENDNIREAVIRYEITKYPQQASLFFVSVYDAKDGQEVDPSDELLNRFAGSKIRISKASDSRIIKEQGDIMVDKHSGAEGTLMSLGGIYRKGENSAEVAIYRAVRDNVGGGFKAFLEKKGGHWEVVKVETTWLP